MTGSLPAVVERPPHPSEDSKTTTQQWPSYNDPSYEWNSDQHTATQHHFLPTGPGDGGPGTPEMTGFLPAVVERPPHLSEDSKTTTQQRPSYNDPSYEWNSDQHTAPQHYFLPTGSGDSGLGTPEMTGSPPDAVDQPPHPPENSKTTTQQRPSYKDPSYEWNSDQHTAPQHYCLPTGPGDSGLGTPKMTGSPPDVVERPPHLPEDSKITTRQRPSPNTPSDEWNNDQQCTGNSTESCQISSKTEPDSMNASQKVEVTVEVIKNDERLDKLVTRMQSHNRPIVAVGCMGSALVIIDWFGVGFILPVPEGGLSSSEESASAQWSSLWQMFQNVNLVAVVFDCGAVGNFLLEKLDLQLGTVFDVKTAGELINGQSATESKLRCNTVSQLCHSLGVTGPGQVDPHVYRGEMSIPGEDGAALGQSVSRAVQEAAALVPGVYSEIFKKLSELRLLVQLHQLTKRKLATLYMTTMSGFLPEDLENILSRQTVGPGNTAAVQAPAPHSRNHHHSNHFQNDSSQISSTNLTDTGRNQIISNVPVKPFPTQNGINQIPDSPSGIGSIRPARNGSTASAGSTHSSRGAPQGSTLGPPPWASTHASMPTHGLFRDTSDQVSVGASLGPQSSKPEWIMPTHLSQGGTTRVDSADSPQPARGDWFSSDLEGELSGIPTEVEQGGELEPANSDTGTPSTMAESSSNNNVSRLTEELTQYYTEKNKESIVLLLDLLGEDIKKTFTNYVQQHDSRQTPTEIVLDVGRRAEARFHKSTRSDKPVVVPVSSKPITNKDLELIEENDALTGFDDNNCCGIEGTLHSVRGIRNRKKRLIGLTIRIGLPLLGCADMMYDIAQSGRSTLILGYPGVGKTTLLRELARCLSDNEKKRVVVIDTYNEIAGDSDVPHFSIGSARRLQVPEHQPAILLESAKNHSPEVIIIDQIDSREDVRAVTRLGRMGIQIIAGTNIDTFQSLLDEESFSQIFQNGDGGLSDVQSLNSAGSLANRTSSSPFEALVEMRESDCWYVHDLRRTLEQMKAGPAYTIQERTRVAGSDMSDGKLSEKILRVNKYTFRDVACYLYT